MTGRYIAKERGSMKSRKERIEELVKARPGTVLTALAGMGDADRKRLAWITRKALATMN
jgi:hypothetical protein